MASEQQPQGIVATTGAGQQASFSWGVIEWLFDGQLAPGAEQTLGHVVIEPGQTNPLHAHPNCEEMLYLLEGEIEHSLDGAVDPMKAGDAIRVPTGARHNARNTGATTARMIIIYSDPARQIVNYEGVGE